MKTAGSLVRVARLELAASCSQSRRATNCATPGYDVIYKTISSRRAYCCGARHLPASTSLLGVCRPRPLAPLAVSATGSARVAPLLRCPASACVDDAPWHLPTAATRSPRCICHWQRSGRSPTALHPDKLTRGIILHNFRKCNQKMQIFGCP